MVTFVDALVYLLAGVAIILLLVVSVYLFAVLCDRLSCLNTSADVLTPYELEERRTATSLMKRAGIAGLLKEERVRVFRYFFEKRAMPYHNTTGDADDDDVEAQKVSQAETSETKSCADDEKHKDPVIKTENIDTKGTENTASNEGDDNGDNENDADKTCPICLNKYDDGEKVMTGTLCSHMFHVECCMQWIEKGNDHCPYCREDMMTPQELLAAAKEEIGTERVEKMVRINQDAARRLAAMREGELLRNTTESGSQQQVQEDLAETDADADTQTESMQQVEEDTNNISQEEADPRSQDIDDSEDPVASAANASEFHSVSVLCTHSDIQRQQQV